MENENKKYFPCDKVIECFPNWTFCERPARVREGQPNRCEIHPVKNIWTSAAEWHEMEAA